MGAASKLSMLLTTPFPFLCARPSVFRLVRHSRVSVAYFSPTSKRKFSSNSRSRLGINVSEEFHTQTTTGVSRKNDDYHPESLGFSSTSGVTHPWSEWCNLVENLGASGYFDRKRTSELGGSDAFTVFDNLPDEFLRAASACLSFARDRSELLSLLSRKDIEVVVENGSPFLFKSAVEIQRRMRLFLSKGGGNDLEVERADMVDLMRFLLSYACNFPGVPEHENHNNRKHVESSVRNLLSELADASRAVRELDQSGSLPKRFPDKFGQTPRPFGKNIEMKRGDWICSKCSFMNFAKNMKCLDCKEARPKRQLTGQEWECPQCEFYNYGRNVVCLRCDCKRPGESTAGSRSDLGSSDGINLSLDDIASRISANDERDERWFGKASYMDNDSEFNRTTADQPDIMPLRKGVNRFVVSTRKTPLERRSFNDQYQENLDSSHGDSERSSLQAGDVNDSAKSSGISVSQSLDRILGRSSSDSKANNGITGRAENKTGTGKSSISRSTSPPFGRSVGSNSDYIPFVPLPADMFSKPQKPKMEEKVRESFNSDTTKAEELVGSSVSDKPIDSLLLSEQPVNQAESTEDKQQAEVGSNSDYFPFVPLPADMFSKPQKPKMEEKVRESFNSDTTKAEELVGSSVSDKPIDSLLLSEQPVNQAESTEDKQQAEVGSNSDYFPFVPLPADMFSKPQKPDMEEKVRESYNADATKAEELVGSSVSDKPIDSLLLSEKPVNQAESTEDKEQAEKSERWFKKVAELHDVTDLASAISDEDFPEIMPMRKGENRFVVSKKKDRSLTSPLYKRRMAMEQENNTNFVPFVPFPPDYFAKKDKHSETGASIQNAKDRTETPAASTPPEIQGGASVKSEERNARGPNYGAVGDSVQRSNDQNSTKRPIDLQNSGSWKESSTSNVSRSIRPNSTPEQPDNSHNRKASGDSGFSGKSLEGSLVKEPDPLDMSEEAKAERWFRRAAQIKDISELSQIPDEDFPEIMPMRKGVNRFVVSKRKTPLERRLTSPQYRRNLPIVSSEPLKKENDES